MGNYNEAAAGEILYSNHPEMLKRLRDMRRLVVEHYANADLSESEVGRERFMESVGDTFGGKHRSRNQLSCRGSNQP